MKKKLQIILTLICVLGVQFLFAQERTISGTVTGPDGLPLPGVNVIVSGTNRGTQTDFDGKYSIRASVGEEILFSFVGFEDAVYPVGEVSIIDVVLAENISELDEVVVVGYGTATKQSFTGTASVISGENLERKNVSNVSQALAGESAGVRVINTSGQPGSSATVRIRGIGSVNGNRAPLYVVDGVPFNGSLNSINPADIESTTILKDAAATAIYGARGANGVIVITTRDGVDGDSFLTVETKTGQNFSLLPRYNTIKSPEQFLELSWEALFNRGVALGRENPADYATNNLFNQQIGIDPDYNYFAVTGAEVIDPATGRVRPNLERKYSPEDWEDYAFQPSRRVETNVRMGGGNDESTYFTSLGYLKDEGYSINSDFQRYSARLNLNHEVKEWLTSSMDFNYSLSETNNAGQSEDTGSIFLFVDNIPAIYPLFLRDQEGNFVPDPYFGGNQYDYGYLGRGFSLGTNSVADALYNVSNTVKHELSTNIFFNVEFAEGLNLETRLGGQYYNSSYDNQENPFYGPSATGTTGGAIYKEKEELFSYNFLQLLRYKKNFDDQSLEAFIAHESTSWELKYLWGYKNKLVDPFGRELNNAVVSNPPGSYMLDYKLESYFGQVNYDFSDTYFISGTIRRDGSSRFLNNKWGNFGAVGAAWVVSNEDFLEGNNFVEYLKFKASYGLIGEQAGVGYYPGVDLYNIDNLNDEISLSFDTKGNPDLTWETSKMFQAGIEVNLEDYLEVSVDYYIKNTDDLIFERRVPPSLGYAIITVNDGLLRNTGVEFQVTGHLVKQENYFLDVSVNGEIVDNELLRMPIDPSTGEEKVLDIQGIYGRSAGHSVYDFYLREYAGVDPADGVGMWYQYFHDVNDNGILNEGEASIESLHEFSIANPDAVVARTVTKTYANSTEKYVGKSAIADVRGAFNLRAGFAGFDLSAQFLYQIGGYAYDGAYASLMHNDVVGINNWHGDILNRWQEPGDITSVPRLSSNFDTNVTSFSTRFLTKTDFLSLNNVRLGYDFSTGVVESLDLKDFNLWISGDNLYLLSARDGFNPSTSETGSSSAYRYSPLSTISVGVQITF